MALARIISRSDLCSRQLALDLLARGYAVEIVSPDAIPDDLADLELRVDSMPENVLTANVSTHDGDRSAFFDFVHQLKSPMVDFRRKPPQMDEAAFVPVDPITLKVKRETTDLKLVKSGNVDLEKADGQLKAPANVDSARALGPTLQIREKVAPVAITVDELVPVTVSPAPIAVVREQPPASAVTGEPTRVIAREKVPPAVPIDEPVAAREVEKDLSTAAVDVEQTFGAAPEPDPPRPAVKITIRRSDWEKKLAARFIHPEGWVWHATIGAAALLVVAISLGMGIRSSDAASSRNSAVSSASAKSLGIAKTSGPTQPAKTGGGAVAPVVSSSATKLASSAVAALGSKQVAGKTVQASNPSARVKDKATVAHHRPPVSHGDDVVAPDTITYLDRPGAKPVPVQELARERAHSSKPSGPIPASKVAPPNATSAPQAGSDK